MLETYLHLLYFRSPFGSFALLYHNLLDFEAYLLNFYFCYGQISCWVWTVSLPCCAANSQLVVQIPRPFSVSRFVSGLDRFFVLSPFLELFFYAKKTPFFLVRIIYLLDLRDLLQIAKETVCAGQEYAISVVSSRKAKKSAGPLTNGQDFFWEIKLSVSRPFVPNPHLPRSPSPAA